MAERQIPIKILYANYEFRIYDSLIDTYSNILPDDVKEKVLRFKKWQDRQSFILGKLLIWKGLNYYNYGDDCLSNIMYNNYGKPYVEKDVFFNLSHSGNYVVCAFHDEEIGIDIEKIRNIEIEPFMNLFSEQEESIINGSSNKLKEFFRRWTIKESVIKAEGKGFTIPLRLIDTSEIEVKYDYRTWIIHEFNLFRQCYCSLATQKNDSQFVIEKVEFLK